MTVVTFVLGLVLIAAGAGGLVASYDLLPTELGLLYACCGAILVSGGVVTVAIGVGESAGDASGASDVGVRLRFDQLSK